MPAALRALPWALCTGSLTFAAATWSALPELIPMRVDASGVAARLVEKSFWPWFGLPLTGLLTVALMALLSALLPKYPALFNHPEKDRFLKLPPAYRAPVFVEMRNLLDAAGASVVITVLVVQWSLWKLARGTGGGSAVVLVLIAAALSTPVVLLFVMRIVNAVDAADKRWKAAGSPSE